MEIDDGSVWSSPSRVMFELYLSRFGRGDESFVLHDNGAYQDNRVYLLWIGWKWGRKSVLGYFSRWLDWCAVFPRRAALDIEGSPSIELVFSYAGVRVTFWEWLMCLPWVYKFLRWLRSVDDRITDKITAPIYYPHGRDAEGNAISPDD
ncbi:hypothetical protein KFZ76_11935 [Methylovulum psychrotolerans]|uniref:hypothetical protein n=1 Tax=Methylovulum psychrotolerans TaxID=1704499 RepID=UPI001BFF94ED|nr:hypothetical protein [Methylovulum psychrotolerans]MBT9098417.1 hypothetical protein [Methylovulum psychrotolerans]